MTRGKTNTMAPCWCRCICHTAMPDVYGWHGTVPCAILTRAGRCGGCRKECNPSRPQDRPNDRPNRRR